MATNEDIIKLIKQYETEFCKIVEENYKKVLNQSMFPEVIRSNGGTFNVLHLNICDTSLERIAVGKDKKGGESEWSFNTKIVDIEDAIIEMYNKILKPKKVHKDSYNSWEDLLAHVLTGDEYAQYMENIGKLYVNLSPPTSFDRKAYDDLGKAIGMAAIGFGSKIFSSKPKQTSQSLLSAYNITYQLFNKGEDYEELSGVLPLNEHLKDPKETTFGRNPPHESTFEKYWSYFKDDEKISDEQGYFLFDKDGNLVYYQVGQNKSRVMDYTNMDNFVEKGQNRILIPATITEDELENKVEAEVQFGENWNYRLRITLQRKQTSSQKPNA